MKLKKLLLITLNLFILSQISAFAEDEKEMKAPKITKEMREKMAETHLKMAECLKSDKAIDECHKEMMKSCEEKMGKDGCPMHKMHGQKMKMKMHHKDHEEKESKE